MIEIILTAIIIIAFALTIGWFIRRFRITRVHLGVLWVLGFALMLIGGEGILFACGIIILCFASGGFMYYWFFLGVEPTAPLERDRLIIDKHRENMKKKIILSSIILVAVVVVAIFAGCIEEETSVPPTPTLDTIKIDVTSTTWREGKKPYDIYSAMEEKLKKAGFNVVPKGSDVYNATLFVDYREEKGGEYSVGFGSDIFAGYGTNIGCYIQLEHKEFGLLFTKEITASTPFSVSAHGLSLYTEAILDFENRVYFKYIGDIIACKYGTGDEISVLISALINDQSRDTRADAAEVLGEIGDKRAVEPLIDALKDADCMVQWNAAEGLGKIGDKRAIEPLIITLKAENDILRERAAEALGEIGDARAVEPLIGALNDEDEGVRSSAAEALGKIGDVRAVQPLINALKDEDWYVRSSAETALKKIRG